MSWLSTSIRAFVPGGAGASDASAAVFNTKKDPAEKTKRDAQQAADAAALQTAQTVTTNPQGQMILMGGAALALILLMKGKK